MSFPSHNLFSSDDVSASDLSLSLDRQAKIPLVICPHVFLIPSSKPSFRASELTFGSLRTKNQAELNDITFQAK